MVDRLIRKQDVLPLGAIGFVLAVTAGWWTLALWSAPGAPEWLERTRSVCFNVTESGLPDAKGWLLLLAQPPTMVAALLIVWGREVRQTLAHLLASGGGRAIVGATVVVVLAGAGLAGARVADARLPEVAWGTEAPFPTTHDRLDRPWPPLRHLLDHTGEPFSLSSLGGRPALVTFAFGHCETLCPVVVQQVRASRDELDRKAQPGAGMSIVVFTLDPWRDTPGRLRPLLEQWGLDPSRDFVVGGAVEAVEAGLDSWGVARTRDPRNGDIVHPGLVYLVEPGGTVAFSSAGGVDHLVELAARMGVGETP